MILHKERNSQAEISRQTGASGCATRGLVKKHIEKLGTKRHANKWQTMELTKGNKRHLKINLFRHQKRSSKTIAADLFLVSGSQVQPYTIRRTQSK